jgi:hypothetical protein
LSLRRFGLILSCVAAMALAGCGPRANIPPRPAVVPGTLPVGDPLAELAVSLAPVLYIHRDEWFPLERVVAVVHPTRPLVAYHLLWRDDIYGSWLPFTVPTDQEIVWVEHEGAGNPTALWTYWHLAALRTDWRGRGRPEIDVQWGKHGNLPRNTVLRDLPDVRTMPFYYVLGWVGIVDAFLGTLVRPGPICFCRSYRRFLEFTDPLPLAERLDAVVVAEDPELALAAVFGRDYSRKPPWPYLIGAGRPIRPPRR